jgi:hypothetical protein
VSSADENAIVTASAAIELSVVLRNSKPLPVTFFRTGPYTTAFYVFYCTFNRDAPGTHAHARKRTVRFRYFGVRPDDRPSSSALAGLAASYHKLRIVLLALVILQVNVFALDGEL